MVNYLEAVRAISPWGPFNFTGSTLYARQEYTPSSWTAAVADVGRGFTTFGASDFWVTRERAAIVPFTSSIGIDVVTLWVKRPKAKVGFWDRVTKVFEPFHWSVWFLCFVLIGLMGAAQSIVAPEGKTGKPLAIVLRKIKTCRKARNWQDAPVFMYELFVSFAKTSGIISLQILGKDEEFPGSTSELLLSIGWSFLILILTSAYTANLAAFLVHTDIGHYYSDTNAAVRASARICLPGSLVPRMLGTHPGAIVVPVSFVGDLAKMWRDNHCDALAWPYGVAKRSPVTAQYMCELDLVAVDTVLEVPLAFPSSRYAAALTYYIEQMPQAGSTYQEVYESPYYIETCSDGRAWRDLGIPVISDLTPLDMSAE